ncbi:DUF465 domain-containing protein [Rhizobium sp. EC-SD404]|uniref:DUF465 domain-containing protein n=1 Tax=Rhizobium sp. EC-SD404 TaxID=2038389 RepID=UPI0018FE84A5|nr:DUF465 domain-containing protein [Rhizobium sp. EC-SD404]
MDPFLNSLRNRRAAIQALINREQARPAPDGLKLFELKKLRLRFREQIEYLERLNREGQSKVIPVIRRKSSTLATVRSRT